MFPEFLFSWVPYNSPLATECAFSTNSLQTAKGPSASNCGPLFLFKHDQVPATAGHLDGRVIP